MDLPKSAYKSMINLQFVEYLNSGLTCTNKILWYPRKMTESTVQVAGTYHAIDTSNKDKDMWL